MEWKKILILSLVSLLIIVPAMTLAQEDAGEETEDIEDPGILPDNAFYGFKLFGERIRMALTFNEKAKITLKMKFAERRLAEAEQMALRNRTQIVQTLMERYRAQVEEAEQVREQLRVKNITAEDVDEWMNRTTNRHIYVLQRVIEKAPEQSRPGLQTALQNAETNREKIRERLLEKIGEMEQEREMEREQIRVTTTTTTQEQEMQGNGDDQGREETARSNATETNDTATNETNQQ